MYHAKKRRSREQHSSSSDSESSSDDDYNNYDCLLASGCDVSRDAKRPAWCVSCKNRLSVYVTRRQRPRRRPCTTRRSDAIETSAPPRAIPGRRRTTIPIAMKTRDLGRGDDAIDRERVFGNVVMRPPYQMILKVISVHDGFRGWSAEL